jgi:hypothetical protein
MRTLTMDKEPPIGTIVTWEKGWKASPSYAFAALRAPTGMWYDTGGHAFSWTQLLRFMAGGDTMPRNVRVGTRTLRAARVVT